MGRSASCLKIITCGSDSADQDDLEASEVSVSVDSSRLVFRFPYGFDFPALGWIQLLELVSVCFDGFGTGSFLVVLGFREVLLHALLSWAELSLLVLCAPGLVILHYVGTCRFKSPRSDLKLKFSDRWSGMSSDA